MSNRVFDRDSNAGKVLRTHADLCMVTAISCHRLVCSHSKKHVWGHADHCSRSAKTGSQSSLHKTL